MKIYGPTNLPSPYRVFPTGRGGVPPPVENLLIHPHLQNFPPTKSQFPPCPTKQQFSSFNLIKTAFLAVATAPAPFLF